MKTKTVFIETTVGNKKVTTTKYVKTGGKKPLFGGLLVVNARKRIIEQENIGRPELGVVDGEALAVAIDEKSNELMQEGFEIVSITPILNGAEKDKGWGRNARSSGFSYTTGVILHCRQTS